MPSSSNTTSAAGLSQPSLPVTSSTHVSGGESTSAPSSSSWCWWWTMMRSSSGCHLHGRSQTQRRMTGYLTGLLSELGPSTEVVFRTRLVWMLALGPAAVLADFSGVVSETLCFCLAGLALIPCAERLSFVTEQVAAHTNGTIGGLLNATFGNAPELLIATAALRSGYYRVVQLAMLGSMLSNMLLVFGVACAIGGARWQVQELRTTSGNANVVMLYVAVAGCLFPAALRLSGQYSNGAGLADADVGDDISPQEVTFCRVNAAVLFVLYLCFLLFQLGTHSEEFEEDDRSKRTRRYARRNESCRWFLNHGILGRPPLGTGANAAATVERVPFLTMSSTSGHEHGDEDIAPTHETASLKNDGAVDEEDGVASFNGSTSHHSVLSHHSFDSSTPTPVLSKRRTRRSSDTDKINNLTTQDRGSAHNNNVKSNPSDRWETLSDAEDTTGSVDRGGDLNTSHHSEEEEEEQPQLSMRMGIVWLLILTLCISSMSDILVDSIDDFALSMRLSEVFTSMVVIPFFSNVAEQVSAFIFAYRNEMDLCVAVTIGSAVQIATFVLPGSVLIGMTLDRSMTLYFGAYETCCLFFSVVVVGAVLQSGSSNWLTGAMLVGTYLIFASGVWFHQLEQLTVDEEMHVWGHEAAAAAAQHHQQRTGGE